MKQEEEEEEEEEEESLFKADAVRRSRIDAWLPVQCDMQQCHKA